MAFRIPLPARRIGLALLLATAGVAPALAADGYPSRPIRVIVPYPAGGPSDVIARNIGEAMSQRLRQPVVVEPRPGAAGTIGASACRSAAPDGHTLCLLIADALVLQPYVYRKLPYDASRDFVPVVSLVDTDVVVAVNSRVPGRDLREVLDNARRAGTPLNWATYGVGSSGHVLLELVSRTLKTEVVNVPYQGGAPAITALLGGQVQMTMLAYGGLAQHIASGAMRPVAALGGRRLAYLPQTPTLAEQGIGFRSTIWQGLFAPRGTPDAVVRRVNAVVNEVLRDPAFVAAHLTPGGYSVTGGSPEDFEKTIRSDAVEWSRIAKALDLNLE